MRVFSVGEKSKNFVAVRWNAAGMQQRNTILRTVVPVSYTHLDVYKRQLQRDNYLTNQYLSHSLSLILFTPLNYLSSLIYLIKNFLAVLCMVLNCPRYPNSSAILPFTFTFVTAEHCYNVSLLHSLDVTNTFSTISFSLRHNSNIFNTTHVKSTYHCSSPQLENTE